MSGEVKIKGRLRYDVTNGTGSNGNFYYRASLEIIEIIEQPVESNVGNNEFNAALLFFWETDFSKEQLETIGALPADQVLVVAGSLGGRENNLVKVKSFSLGDNQNSNETNENKKTCSHSCELHCKI